MMLTRAQTEQWKPVVGYEGLYEVSSFGSVRSLPRSGTRQPKPYLLTPWLHGKDKYKYLCVNLSRNNKPKTRPVHQLVLEAFIGPCPKRYEAGHGNGVYTDNCLSNLSWITKKDNAADRTKHGTQLIGQKHHQAKLTNEQALAIFSSDLPTKVLADQYRVCKATVRNIRRGSHWKGITHVVS